MLSLLIGVAAHATRLQATAQSADTPDKISVESNLVELNVNVFSRKPNQAPPPLSKDDFVIFDNDIPQPVSFFESRDTPFDLFLLLDLSGSIQDKLDLVKKSAGRFIEAARPIDRVSVATFTDKFQLVSPLSTDRAAILEKIRKIKKPSGSTKFWDALNALLTSDDVRPTEHRRKAVIIMTDGVDTALENRPPGFDGSNQGSTTNFVKLIETVRRSGATLLPIYLDTEDEEVRYHGATPRAYELARKSLAILASESGGIAYRANKIEDLESVFTEVIRDLGTYYSIGYQPITDSHPGEWRKITVRVSNRPDLAARTKSGYYAR